MVIEIEVTEQHIEQGEGGNCERCPIALAIHALIPCLALDVNPDVIVLKMNEGGPWRTLTTPPAVAEFIGRFDGGYFVKPFSFELECEVFHVVD